MFLGPQFSLKCLRHQNITKVETPADIYALEHSGCNMACAADLECGHSCRNACHGEDLEHTTKFTCKQPCLKWVHARIVYFCIFAFLKLLWIAELGFSSFGLKTKNSVLLLETWSFSRAYNFIDSVKKSNNKNCVGFSVQEMREGSLLPSYMRSTVSTVSDAST